ncbi:MAG: Gfo/Idh/MocA family oxidoreductase, partial [Ruminococcaceae bacterium]|nr:Gfo/Idh/MocA family oxidoreductase [Oscillospiraceae bacterium]
MKKLNLAIIGQGRSGKNIHGKYYRSEDNCYYDVKYVVDADEFRRNVALKIYPGCQVLPDYRELFDHDDIDLVVNSTYSEMHYAITKDLLLHGKNVLVEKPFGRSRYECDELIKIANEKNLTLAVFQQTFLAPFYTFTYDLVKSGKLGDIKQINIRYNSFSRRWDWQTLQKKCAGGVYNTGPHPIGIGLGLLDFDKNAKVIYSKLDTALTSGDSDDYAKILIAAPEKPLVDIEVTNIDA